MSELKTMYAAQANSPNTTIAGEISATDTQVVVVDVSVLPSAVPYLLTLGYDKSAAETVLVTAVNGNTLTITRGVDGLALFWIAGTKCARTLTAKDINDLQTNVTTLDKDQDTHINNKSNPHGVTLAQIGAEAAGAAAAVQVNLENHTGNKSNPHGVIASQIGAADIALSNVTNADFASKAGAAGVGGVTFVYKCTGTADSTAIATIVNNFFNSGTAMSMKLIISGTMGVAFTTNYAMLINATNTRGAVCTLDFSDCYIPTITTTSTYFMYISSATTKLNVVGLVVTAYSYGIYLNSSNYNTFDKCIITVTYSYGESLTMIDASNNTFNNCTFNAPSGTSYGYGVRILNFGGGGTKNNTFNNCIISGAYGFYQTSQALTENYELNNNRIINCTIIAKYTVYLENANNNIFDHCVIVSSSTGAAVYFYIKNTYNLFTNCFITSTAGSAVAFQTTPNDSANRNTGNTFNNCSLTSTVGIGVEIGAGYVENTVFNNCTITGATWGVLLGSNFSSVITFVACKILGSTYGITAQTANTAAIIRLIGCSIKGSGSAYDVNQTTAASTMSWYIMGCAFAYSSIYVNGAAKSVSTATALAFCYMPAYANMFSRTIS